MATRRRGGSFHEDINGSSYENDNGVQFLTPYFHEDGGPEPLDLSKLRLDLDPDVDEEEEEEEEEDEERMYSRGRSRSRSVHEYDDNSAQYIPHVVDGEEHSLSNTAESIMMRNAQNHAQHNNNNVNTCAINGKAERSGPLQHREVVALQKGLEEATQSMSKFHSREDEEERMAAETEKRKRMLAAQNLSQSTEPARRIKLLLLGDSGVGKSSLIMRWTLDTFSPSLVSTVGVNFKSKKVSMNGELIQVQVWDTAGQEQFHKITTSYYKGAQGIMLVYDVADQKSLENVEYWIKNIKSNASDSVQVVLIGNKIDLRQVDAQKKCVDTERGKEIAMKFGVPFFETSAKDSSHVDEAFMTLVNHISELTSPSKSIARTSLQGGLDRKTGNEKIEKEKCEKELYQGKEKVSDKDNQSNKTRIFGGLLGKDKKHTNSPDGKSSPTNLPSHNNQHANGSINQDEKCVVC